MGRRIKRSITEVPGDAGGNWSEMAVATKTKAGKNRS